jgi:hypothetical protein
MALISMVAADLPGGDGSIMAAANLRQVFKSLCIWVAHASYCKNA